MARIRIASCIIASLSFLRILPNGKKNFIDMFGLCFWTTFAILASGIGWRMLVDTIKNLLDAGYIKTITGVFSIMSTGLLPFLVVLAFPLLAYFGRHYPMLVKENSLPFPHQPLLFAAVMLFGTNYLAFVVMDILKTPITVQTVCMIVLHAVSCLTFFIQMFIIGVSTEVVFRKASIDCKEDITVTTVNYCTGVVLEFKALKKALSPLLLTVVGSQTAFSVSISYSLFVAEFNDLYPAILIQILGNLAYICSTLGDCHSAFQAMASKLRPLLIGANATQHIILTNLIHEIESEAPFRAGGLFSVDWSTFASIISTILTYLIILVQGTSSEIKQFAKNITNT